MEIKDAARRLSALSSPHRLAVFRLLVRAGPEGIPAGEIAEALDMPPSSLSFHLSHLEKTGMVTATRSGRNVLYCLDTDAMRELMAFLSEDCCQGRPELCAGVSSVPLSARAPGRPGNVKRGRAR